jgi:hypothetical protein
LLTTTLAGMNASDLFSLIPTQTSRLFAMLCKLKSTVQCHLEPWKILQ